MDMQDYEKTRISRIVSNEEHCRKNTYLMFSNGQYAAIITDYIFDRLDVNNDIVVPTFVDPPVPESRNLQVLDTLYVMRQGKLFPQLPRLRPDDIAVTPYYDFFGIPRLMTYLSEEAAERFLCEAYAEGWHTDISKAVDSSGKTIVKCILTCRLPIADKDETFESVVDIGGVSDEEKQNLAVASTAAYSGIYHEICRTGIPIQDPDVKSVRIGKEWPRCEAKYHVDSIAFKDNGEIESLVIKNSETGNLVVVEKIS